MSLYIKGFDPFDVISYDTAITQTGPTPQVSTIAAGVFILTSLYLLFQASISRSRSLTDKAGNNIPTGPLELPIVGQFHEFFQNLHIY